MPNGGVSENESTEPSSSVRSDDEASAGPEVDALAALGTINDALCERTIITEGIKEDPWQKEFLKTTPWDETNEKIIAPNSRVDVPFSFDLKNISHGNLSKVLIIDHLDPNNFTVPDMTDSIAKQTFLNNLGITGTATLSWSQDPAQPLTQDNFQLALCGSQENPLLYIAPGNMPKMTWGNDPDAFQINLVLPSRVIDGPTEGEGIDATLENAAYANTGNQVLLSRAHASISTTSVPWTVRKGVEKYVDDGGSWWMNLGKRAFAQNLSVPTSGADLSKLEFYYHIELNWHKNLGTSFDGYPIADVVDQLPDTLKFCSFRENNGSTGDADCQRTWWFSEINIPYGNGNTAKAKFDPKTNRIVFQAPTKLPNETRTDVYFRVRLSDKGIAEAKKGNLSVANEALNSTAVIGLTPGSSEFGIAVMAANDSGESFRKMPSAECSDNLGTCGNAFRFELYRLDEHGAVAAQPLKTGLRLSESGLVVNSDGTPLFVDRVGQYRIRVTDAPAGYTLLDQTPGVAENGALITVNSDGESRLEVLFFKHSETPVQDNGAITLKKIVDSKTNGSDQGASKFQLSLTKSDNAQVHFEGYPKDTEDKSEGAVEKQEGLPLGTYVLQEKMVANGALTLPSGYRSEWTCYAGAEKRTVTPTAVVGEATVELKAGDDLVCTTTNTSLPVSIRWSKVDGTDQTPLAGSEWELKQTTLFGPNGNSVPSSSPQAVSDCVSAPCGSAGDQDPRPGFFRIDGQTWGEYTLTETKTPMGYTGGEPTSFTASSSTGTQTDGAIAVAPTLTGQILNERILGAIEWKLIDDSEPGVPLKGSGWTLYGPGLQQETLVPASTEIEGKPWEFKLEGLQWGTYTLKETAPPSGYRGTADTWTFTIDGSNSSEPLKRGKSFVNERIKPVGLPSTGGTARDLFMYIGFGVVAIASAAGYGQHRLKARAAKRE